MESKNDNFKITKKLIENINTIDNPTIGYLMAADARYIIKNHGEQGLKLVEERFKKLGYNFQYYTIEDEKYYPMSIRILSLLIGRELFKWTDDDFRKMGEEACRISMLLKILIRFFVLPSTALSKAPEFWRKHNKKGTLSIKDYNYTNGRLVGCLDDYHSHPVVCRFLEGYFTNFMKFAMHVKKVKVKEIKCNHKTGHHEFLVTWTF